MAGETLKTASQLLADAPDNQAGLIDAVFQRNQTVSVTPAVGFMEDDDSAFSVPIPDLVTFVNLNPLISPVPVLATNYWEIDGNQAWLPSYVTKGIIVPAGVIRLVGGQCWMVVEKAGGGTGSYEFQWFKAGVAIGVPQQRLISSVPSVEVIAEELLYEVSLAEPLDVRVRGVDTTDDLTITDFRQRMTGIMI